MVSPLHKKTTILMYTIIYRVSGQGYLEDQHTLLCFETFMNLLHYVPTRKLEPNTQCKVCCMIVMKSVNDFITVLILLILLNI